MLYLKKVANPVVTVVILNVLKMILKEEDIKNILNRHSTVVGNRMLGIKLNQYEYGVKELLDLIQTYIYENKGIDIGSIEKPKGDICASFLELYLKITGSMNINRCSDFNALNVASDVALNYFYNKYRE